jgi:hypothetical protein
MKKLRNMIKDYRASLFIMIFIGIIYFIIFILSTININGFEGEIFSKTSIKIVLFFLLIVANWHLYITIQSTKYKLKKYILIIFTSKSRLIQPSGWRERILNSKIAFFAGLFLFISYFFILIIYCP